MTEKPPVPKKAFSADWLLRGALTKIGDTVDRFTGRRYRPSSSLATSELIERIKRLLDAEARKVEGKGTVVPHKIKLKVQWNKFSTEEDKVEKALETELLTATIDHINDSLYYTFAPVRIEVKPDYFIEGVKLTASFDEKEDVELNVTLPSIAIGKELLAEIVPATPAEFDYVARFTVNEIKKERQLKLLPGKSISIGRNGSNGLVIDDASVSKIHASLSVNSEGILSVADTGSTNGTFINSERIAYGKAIPIASSDKLKIGTVAVELEKVEQFLEDTAVIAATQTIEVDGLEFTSRVPEDTPPVIEKPEMPAEPAAVETEEKDDK